jgi:hypothetical protein
VTKASDAIATSTTATTNLAADRHSERKKETEDPFLLAGSILGGFPVGTKIGLPIGQVSDEAVEADATSTVSKHDP